MSQHRSLKGQSTLAATRNVLKRFERVELLKQRGLYKQGDKVLGLRKTKPNESLFAAPRGPRPIYRQSATRAWRFCFSVRFRRLPARACRVYLSPSQ